MDILFYHEVKLNEDEKFSYNQFQIKMNILKSISFLKNNLNEISFILVPNKYIEELNYQYKKIQAPTDVLTFDTSNFENNQNKMSEIYISLDKAKEQAIQHKITLSEELIILGIHGFLHALGYDHEKSLFAFFYMKYQEKKILKHLNLHYIPSLMSA